MAKLTSIPTLVQAPFIIAKIGNFTFGSYSGGHDYSKGSVKVTYPNYMKSINIMKVNGKINTYTLTFEYQITANDDPNLLDKVFSTTANDRKIILSYGDWNAPSYIYKEEECLIINVKSTVSVQASKIIYTVDCISTSARLAGIKYDFPQYTAKPSSIIKAIINNSTYKIGEIFTGMNKNKNKKVDQLIASDDQKVTIHARSQINIIDYIGYLVECMLPEDTGNITPFMAKKANIKSAKYYLVVNDDLNNEQGGNYFRVVKVNASRNPTQANVMNQKLDVYEIDIGYPGDNFVTAFETTSDEQYSILYEEATKIEQEQYIYRIDNNGNMTTTYSPAITRSQNLKRTTAADESWWNQVTSFPISARLTIKGLTRPSILMSYVKLNVLFYGREHITSGLYIIIKQEDTINNNGYSTTLTLQRIPQNTK